MKTLTQPTICAVCGGDLYSELVQQDEHGKEWAFKVHCPNPDCSQCDQDGFVRAVENPSA